MRSHSLDILALVETHIRPSDTDSLLRSITPPNFQLCQRPRRHSICRGVGYLIGQTLQHRLMDSSSYHTFENMIVSVPVPGKSLMLASIYRPPGSCSMAFLDEFMSFVSFISSIKDQFIIVGDFSIHIDVSGGDGLKFLSLIEALKLDQLVNQLVTSSTHLHGHTLDLVSVVKIVLQA